jgi:hypothetical protein
MPEIEQPLVLEHNGKSITLSGMKQMLMELTPEQLVQLEKELQDVINKICTLYVGPIPMSD